VSPNIPLSALLSNTLNFHSHIKQWIKIISLCILISRFLESRWEYERLENLNGKKQLSSLVLLTLLDFTRALIRRTLCFTALPRTTYLDLSSEKFPTFIIKNPGKTSDPGVSLDTQRKRREL
jgi:hypothetical protein